MGKCDLLSLSMDEVGILIQAMNEPVFRGKQLYQWIHQKQVFDYSQMSNIPKKMIEKLSEETYLKLPEVVEVQTSKIDGTQKYLFRLQDNHMVESVLMKYKHGNSVCISTQVGCKMGCKFCASTLDGWVRNLSAGEMLAQVYLIQKISEERVSNVVLMGTGEPLDNYEQFVKFVKMISDENGLHISQRNLTVSTCGIVPMMYRLAEEHFQITLALSLHASNQDKRLELMPIANQYPLEEVMQACKYYFEQTGRRITFEYSLVGGVNDSRQDVEQLIHLVKGLNCHMNLIPVNPIKERSFVQSQQDVILSFKNKLEKNGINVTIRREMGRDIDGACGQLRQKHLER